MKISKMICSTLVLFSLSLPGYASPVTFDISWLGFSGSTMTGSFSYDDTTAADGWVRDRDGDLLSLELSTADFGGLAWVWDTDSTDPFNFNFDAVNELLPLTGAKGSTEAQSWNGVGVGIGLGYEATSGRSGLLINGQFREATASLVLTRRDEGQVPAPSVLALLGLGLLTMGVVRRKQG